MGKKKQFWLAITVLCLKTASSSFPKYSSGSFWRAWSQCCHNRLQNWEHARLGYRWNALNAWETQQMSQALNQVFSFALVFWNISWLTVICSAFESFPLKRGTALLLLPQTSEKCFFLALHFFYSNQHLVWHIRHFSDTCPISSFPFSPTDCCLQNKSRGQVLIYLFTNWASQQQGVSSYCHIYKHRKWWGLKPFWQNLALSIHIQAAYGINLASNIHQGRTNMLEGFFHWHSDCCFWDCFM